MKRQANVVLLPTYNEADNLPAIIDAILQAAPVDILVLDDNSPDGTGRMADAIAAKESRVQVVHRAEKKGLGRAYLDGFRRALQMGYQRIIQMDADFSHPPAMLAPMIKHADTHDLVLGSRWVDGGGTERWPWYRRAISLGGSLYARTLLGVQVRDLTGGFKCFRREVLEGIDLDTVDATGYAFQIEVTYLAIKRGFTVYEMPITFTERANGISKMSQRIVIEAMLKVPAMRLRSGR